jgi:hypothetical protein
MLNHRKNFILSPAQTNENHNDKWKYSLLFKNQVLWGITTCRLPNIYWRFEGTQWLRFQFRQLRLKIQGFFENSSNIFQLKRHNISERSIIFDIEARNSKLVWPDVLNHVSGVDSVPPRKSVPHISCWTERRVQLDYNVPTGQRHPDAIRSVGVLWRTRPAERQTQSQLCGQQDEEGELQYCRISIEFLDVATFCLTQFVMLRCCGSCIDIMSGDSVLHTSA